MNLTDVFSPMIDRTRGISANTFLSTSSDTRIGNARKTSVIRIKMSSSLPPRYPAIAPTMVPTVQAMSATEMPIMIEMRPP